MSHSVTSITATEAKRLVQSEITTRTLASTLDQIDVVESEALQFARCAGFSGDELEKIGIAVREVIAAVIHGNRLDSDRKVMVTFGNGS